MEPAHSSSGTGHSRAVNRNASDVGPSGQPLSRVRRWLLGRVAFVVALAVLGAVAGLAVSTTVSTSYAATSIVYVTAVPRANGNDDTTNTALNAGNVFILGQISSYATLATTDRVTGPTIRRLGLSTSDSALAATITPTVPLNTTLIKVQVTSAGAQASARVSTAVATQLATVIETFQATGGRAARSTIRARVTQAAKVPSAPTSVSRKLLIVAGLLAGLLVGLLAVVVWARVRPRIRRPADVGVVTDLPVIGIVHNTSDISSRKDSIRRTALYLRADDNKRAHALAVTSPYGGEGRTTVAIHLAQALAEIGATVCLVDADLRRPSLHGLFSVVNSTGLSSVLLGDADLDSVLQQVSEQMWVLPSGPAVSDPGATLASSAAQSTVERLTSVFNYVVIDSAAVLPVTDGVLASALADTTVLVVKAAGTSYDGLARAADALEAGGATVAGVVLNGTPGRPVRSARKRGNRADASPSPRAATNADR